VTLGVVHLGGGVCSEGRGHGGIGGWWLERWCVPRICEYRACGVSGICSVHLAAYVLLQGAEVVEGKMPFARLPIIDAVKASYRAVALESAVFLRAFLHMFGSCMVQYPTDVAADKVCRAGASLCQM
jgi:hypothetical protein